MGRVTVTVDPITAGRVAADTVTVDRAGMGTANPDRRSFRHF
jgi:hypothetical protein